MNQEILTVPEVAQYLKISEAKLYQMIQASKIPHIRIGKNVRISKDQLEDYLKQNTMSIT